MQTDSYSNTLEYELLLSCARTRLDALSIERINNVLQQPIDWAIFAQMALNQGVLSLVSHHLNTHFPSFIPQDIQFALMMHAQSSEDHNKVLSLALCKTLKLLAEQNIRAIPYKGVLFAATIYGNIGLRQCSDVDILVHPTDYLHSRNFLLANGFKLVEGFDLEWECALTVPEGNAVVDLHRTLLPDWFVCPIEFDELWVRCTLAACCGQSVPNLSPEDSLVVLSLYVMKDMAHESLILSQICDIAGLVTKIPIDWQKITEGYKLPIVHRAVKLSLQLCTKFYNDRRHNLFRSGPHADDGKAFSRCKCIRVDSIN